MFDILKNIGPSELIIILLILVVLVLLMIDQVGYIREQILQEPLGARIYAKTQNTTIFHKRKKIE
jgi:hypothetical protein